MWNRKGLLKWNTIRFGQTSGSAHQESRSPDEGELVRPTPGVRQIAENRKRSFSGWVTGLQGMKGFGPEWTETRARSSGKWAKGPEGHSVPEIQPKGRKKGQPEGPAIKSRTWKPGVAGRDRKTSSAAGQNNSNPTPFAASAAPGEWESVNAIGSHYCFILSFCFHSLLFIFYLWLSTLNFQQNHYLCPTVDYQSLLTD